MKKSLLIVLTITIMSTFIVISCSNDENDLPTEEDTRYYVKYEVSFSLPSTIAFKTTHEIKYTNENGELKIAIQGRSVSWDGTYGPVEKGFVASLGCVSQSYSIHARIYVCREKEPFVIKAEGEQTNSLSLKYIIDF